jgi:hypothetical protein
VAQGPRLAPEDRYSPGSDTWGRPSRTSLVIAPQGSWRISGWSATSGDHVLQMLPVDVDPLEARRPQIVQLLVKGDHVAHVVLVARLLLRRAMEALACRLRVVAIIHSCPGGFDNRVRGTYRVVVDVPAARGQVLEDLGEQAVLPVIGQVVDAHRGHDC